MTRRIDHTAIAVANLDEAIGRYAELLEAVIGDRMAVPSQQVEVCFLKVGDTQIELICPTDADSGVARFLERRGEGLHHVAIAVEDIEAELGRLAAGGIELIDREPRPGVHGLIAFVHPRGTGGTLLELVQNDE